MAGSGASSRRVLPTWCRLSVRARRWAIFGHSSDHISERPVDICYQKKQLFENLCWVGAPCGGSSDEIWWNPGVRRYLGISPRHLIWGLCTALLLLRCAGKGIKSSKLFLKSSGGPKKIHFLFGRMQLLQAQFFHPSHLQNCSRPVNMYLIVS